jgi:hypothetical protein
MTQLHCYVPEEIAQQAQRQAEQCGLSISLYLAELVKRDVLAHSGWPAGYFDIFVPIQGAELQRPPQGEPKKRDTLE